MNAATFLLLNQVTRGGGMYRPAYRRSRTTGYGAAYAGKATTVGGAGTDPDNKVAVVIVALATCAALGCCAMMALFLKPIL